MDDRTSSMTAEGLGLEEHPSPVWYAVRTRSRHENLVRRQLAGLPGVDVFLPLWTRSKRWTDRKKMVDLPLFPGYCFARTARQERYQILRMTGVVEFVGMNGHAEPIPDDEIDAIRRLVSSKLAYDPHPFLTPGLEVEVVRGPLMGVRGQLVRKYGGTRLVLSVGLLRQSAAVDIDADDVARI